MPEKILPTDSGQNTLPIPDANETAGAPLSCYVFRLVAILCILNQTMQKVTVAADELAAANAQKKSDYNIEAFKPNGVLDKDLQDLQNEKDPNKIGPLQAKYQTDLNKIQAHNDRLEQLVQNSRTLVGSCASAQSQNDNNVQGILNEFQALTNLITKTA